MDETCRRVEVSEKFEVKCRDYTLLTWLCKAGALNKELVECKMLS